MTAIIFEKVMYITPKIERNFGGDMFYRTIVVDANNEKGVKNIKEYTLGEISYNLRITGQKINDKNEMLITETTDNDPVQKLRVITSVSTKQGTTFWIALPNRFVVGVEDETIMQAILINGIKPGGYLSGEYVWGRNDKNKITLISTNSKLYERCVENLKHQNKETIAKEFIAGKIYKSKTKYLLCLGKGYCKSLKTDKFLERDIWIQIRHSSNLVRFKEIIGEQLDKTEPKELYFFYVTVGKQTDLLEVGQQQVELDFDLTYLEKDNIEFLKKKAINTFTQYKLSDFKRSLAWYSNLKAMQNPKTKKAIIRLYEKYLPEITITDDPKNFSYKNKVFEKFYEASQAKDFTNWIPETIII